MRGKEYKKGEYVGPLDLEVTERLRRGRRRRSSIPLFISKFVLHYIALPTLYAVLGTVTYGSIFGGFSGIMGGAFVAALIPIALERNVFLPLYKMIRGKDYRKGEYGPPL